MNDIATIDKAIAQDPNEEAKEAADVERWDKTIKQARKYDEEARKQYARDRRYARGDSSFAVDANIVGTNIDILESFLYARDPDVDALPAPSCQPPSKEAIRDMAEMEFEQMGQRPPEIQQAGAQAAAMAVSQGMPQEEALIVGMMAENAAAEQLIQAEFDRLRKRYERRQRDAKAFAETVEIVVSHLWKIGGLKNRGRRMVRSGLTIGLGVLKASWQERTAPSPETVSAINDLQRNIKEAARLRAEMDESSGDELDVQMADYRRQLEALRGEGERVVARGFVIDQVAGEDFQVAPGYLIANHLDAPWNAHRIPMLAEDAKAEFNLTTEQIGKTTKYTARKPVMPKNRSANEGVEQEAATANEADGFVTAADASGSADGCEEGSGEWVMAWEAWDRTSGFVFTWIEGLKKWVKAPWQPKATTRFYPFFVYAMSEVDGQRHPQSPVSRASKLVDEYNRIGTQEAEHRRRCIPKTLFHKGQIGQAVMTDINNAAVGEMVGVETTTPGVNFSQLFYAAPYAAIDPALYDRQRIVNEIERIFGVQEALGGAVTVAKTATEAEIQQQGFQARSGSRRDMLETMLQDFGQYTAENAHAHLDFDDVRAIAGPDALWPEYQGPEDLGRLVGIEIRAGSTGKPNTAAEREAWSAQVPLLEKSIMAIGQLRNSKPEDVADCLVKLLEITAQRTGDRLDVDSLIPKVGPPPMPMPTQPTGGDSGGAPTQGAPPPDETQPTNPTAALPA